MPKAVFDSVIFVRAILNPHNFSGRLLFEYLRYYRLFLSPPLIEEILEVDEIPHVSRDPKDDKFLAAAKAAGAGYVVSEDKDLLDLKKYEGIKIITAEEFLEILEQEKQ